MTISRVKPANWGVGEKLTSAQQNQLDTNTTYALDKRAGQTDTLSSLVTLAAASRIIQSVAAAADADTTYQIDTQVLGVRIGTPNVLSAQRSYTLSNTNATNGDEISFFFDPAALGSYNVLIKDNGGATLATLGPSSTAHWGEFKFVSGAWVLKRLGGASKQSSDLFSASGSWICPAGVTEVTLHGVGAGGGGGGGAGTAAGAGDTGTSGAGGGGAKLGVMRVPTTPGTTYTVTCGTAGAGGAAGAVAGAGGDGADGGDTTFSDGVTTYTFRGAGGGKGGAAVGGNDYAPGGRAIRNGLALSTINTLGNPPDEGCGGWGWYHASFTTPGTSYLHGGPSPIGAGGASGSIDGAPAGAGGGMSGFVGAVPGIGGDSFLDTVGEAGSAGTLGAGGGGGASGGVVGSDRAGGAGGAGGAGALRIVYVK